MNDCDGRPLSIVVPIPKWELCGVNPLEDGGTSPCEEHFGLGEVLATPVKCKYPDERGCPMHGGVFRVTYM